MTLSNLSDGDLLSRLQRLGGASRRIDARVIVHLMEVEDRRLELRSACSSLFDFCQRRLGMSGGAAFRRINAARLVRRFPSLLGHLESGKVHLSNLVLLRDHLTEANLEELIEAAAGKTKLQVQELIAERAPRPDVPAMICELPSASGAAESAPMYPAHAATAVTTAPAGQIEPLAARRYMVQLTASAELREKLERAKALMRHRNPQGDLAQVVEAALDLLLAKLEKERLGKVSKPKRVSRIAKPDHVASAARRVVFERDGEQCTFRDEDEQRCPARAFLEIDHIDPRACGGSSEPANLRVLCRPHNRLEAERVFGQDHIARAIHLRQQKSSPPTRADAESPFDVAHRGLMNLGFRQTEARKAIDAVRSRHANAPPIAEILREALSVLTPVTPPASRLSRRQPGQSFERPPRPSTGRAACAQVVRDPNHFRMRATGPPSPLRHSGLSQTPRHVFPHPLIDLSRILGLAGLARLRRGDGTREPGFALRGSAHARSAADHSSRPQ